MLSTTRSMKQTLPIAVTICWLFLCWTGKSSRGENPIPSDTTLQSVAFLDANRGWAVGERGLIWQTTNGGTDWVSQPSGVTCKLGGITFGDARTGWIVGGQTMPYSNRSIGVVLKTTDSGRTWKRKANASLPELRGVRAFGSDHLVAFGVGTPAFPAGVWTSTDGGTTWKTATPPGQGSWLAGDFFDPLNGALAGRNGRLATFSRRSLHQAKSADLGSKAIHAMRLRSNGSGWMAGDGGLLMQTRDAGRSWQIPPEGQLAAMRSFDFYAVAIFGENIWCAGTPGTRIFYSRDNGKSWASSATGVFAPLRSIHFISPSLGWAVGELGTILATRDGGKTWARQRAGGKRAAILSITARSENIPFHTFAQLAAADGYLATALVLLQPEVTTRSNMSGANDARIRPSFPFERTSLPSRTREAALNVGATSTRTAWLFPAPNENMRLSPQALWQRFEKRYDSQAAARLEAYLVREIRTWRPEIVLLPSHNHGPPETAEQLFAPAILSAIAAAADPTRHVHLTTEAGLGAWQVKKVYERLHYLEGGSITFDTMAFDLRLAKTLSEISATSHGLLGVSQEALGNRESFSLLQTTLQLPPSASGSRSSAASMLAGLNRAGSEGFRRELLIQTGLTGQELLRAKKIAQKKCNVQAMLENKAHRFRVSAAMHELTPDLDARTRGSLWLQMANHDRENGLWEEAAKSYTQLLEQSPEHPAAESVLPWLLAYHSSAEVSHQLGEKPHVSRSRIRLVGGEEPMDSPNTSVRFPSLSNPAQTRNQRALAIGKYIKKRHSFLHKEPSVLLPLIAAQREEGYTNDAERSLMLLKKRHVGDALAQIVATERWLSEPKETPPQKPIWTCAQATEKPYLDGLFKELLWKKARPIRLNQRMFRKNSRTRTAQKEKQPASLRIARDQQFLYIAIECPKHANVGYSQSAAPRKQDANLKASDRVNIFLDTDRDYTTSWQLSIDSSGRTFDACWGNTKWNPKWFVAQHSNAKTWFIEAAIPLSQLTSDPPRARDAWAVGVQRIIPSNNGEGVEIETWAIPPEMKVRTEHFGLLLFRGG